MFANFSLLDHSISPCKLDNRVFCFTPCTTRVRVEYVENVECARLEYLVIDSAIGMSQDRYVVFWEIRVRSYHIRK